MFFTKHDIKKCPRCLNYSAHVKRNTNLKETNCYFCGYSCKKETNTERELIETINKPIYVLFKKRKNIIMENNMSSDLEWFINEYLVENNYLDLSEYDIYYFYDENIDVDNILSSIQNDDYHFFTKFKDNELFMISCGQLIQQNISLLKNLKRVS